MVIDTSAVIAILDMEPEAERFAGAIEADSIRLMSAASVLEATIVVERRRGEYARRELDYLLLRSGVETVSFDVAQLQLARNAYRTYGRGRHRAGLNYGDCFSYALAKATGEPLLFKGGDFALTDVEAAL